MTFSIGIQFIHIVLFGIIIGKNKKRIQKLIGIWFKNQQHTGYSNEIPFLAREKKRQWIPNYFHCVGEKEGKGSTWRWLGSFVWVVKQIQLGKEQKSTLEICSMENLHSLSLWGKFPPQEQASINISCLKPWGTKWIFHTEQKWQFQTIVVFLLSNQGGKEYLFPWLWNASGVKYNADLNNLSFLGYLGPAKLFTHHSLEAGVELDEEWGFECHCKHSLFYHRALDVVVLVVVVMMVIAVVLLLVMIMMIVAVVMMMMIIAVQWCWWWNKKRGCLKCMASAWCCPLGNHQWLSQWNVVMTIDDRNTITQVDCCPLWWFAESSTWWRWWSLAIASVGDVEPG